MNRIDIFNDDEFQALPQDKKQTIATNYFNKELADDEFNSLDEDKKTLIIGNFVNAQINPIAPVTDYNDVGNVHEAPNVNGTETKEKTFWDKTKDFVKGGVDEAKRFLHIGADGLETGFNTLNPIESLTGEIDLIKDTPKHKEFLEKKNENKIDKSLISDIEALARTDIRLIGEATQEQKDGYLKNVAGILAKGGYALGQNKDGEYVALDDEGNEKAISNDLFESIVDGIVADAGEISGALYGAYKGAELAKVVPNPIARALVVLGSSGIGAITGTALDTAISDLKGNQDLNIEDYLNELSKSAVLDMAGNAIGYGIVKVGGKIIELPKEVKDYIANGNINGARKILKEELDINESFIDDAIEQAKQSYKEVDDYSKNSLTDKSKQQEELLAAAQKDKKFGTEYIKNAIIEDKDVAVNVAKTIDTRTKNLIDTFGDVKIDGSEVKSSVNNYESGVQKQYSDMRDTFQKAFENVDLSFDLKSLNIDKVMTKVVDDIVDPYQKETAENLIKTVKKTIDNTKTGTGVTRDIDNLIELRQVANKFYSKHQKSFSYHSKEIFTQLKKNIDETIENSVRKYLPKETHKPMMDMFENAIKDYREMYEIQDTGLYKALMGDDKNAKARLDGLINHTADDEKEFETLLKKLPFEEQQKIENSIVGSFIDKNLVGKDNELQVVDYKKVADSLESLENFFVTNSGKDSINLMKDMATKYGDDIELLKVAIKTSDDTTAGIATTIKGRIEYKIAKNAYDRIIRLIPFSNTSKRLALQNHISEALKKSRTPVDLAKRVISSEEIPQNVKTDLKDILTDHNKLLKIKKDKEAQKLLEEIENRELNKKQYEKTVNDEIANFKTPTREEINVVEELTPDDKYGSFSQLTTKIYRGIATAPEIEQYVKAKNKIDPSVYNKRLNELKYPINQESISKLSELNMYDENIVNNIIDKQHFKALRYDLKNGKFRNKRYEDVYYQLMNKYEELQPKIKELYSEESLPIDLIEQGYKQLDDGTVVDPNGKTLFSKGIDNLAVGMYAGIEDDEDGNLTFNPESFIAGLGGYTVAKYVGKKIFQNYKLDEKVKEKISNFILDAENEMSKLAGGGRPPIVEKNFIDNQGFYSVLEKTVDEKVGGKIDSISLAKMLEKNGVKEDEIEWSGLKELMNKKEKLTKEEIEETIKENRLSVEVVERGVNNKIPDIGNDLLNKVDEEDRALVEKMILEEDGKLTDGTYEKEWDYLHKKYKDKIDLNEIHDAQDERIENILISKYDTYKVSGGENYRELLFRTPDIKGDYVSTHWDESNIVVFTRVDDRTIDNKKTLFIEELQSDWHQAGRQKGYQIPDDEVEALEAQAEDIFKKYGLKFNNEVTENNYNKLISKGLEDNEKLILDNYSRIEKNWFKLVPEAPFKKNWTELGMKRMLQEAVANDYDKLAWTTGSQQTKRYSLEKKADLIAYNKSIGALQITNNGNQVVDKAIANDEELETIIGKELTRKLLDPKNSIRENVYALKGDELEFGGDGMKTYYDKIVPNTVKKLFKKYNVKPKIEELDEVDEMVWSIDIPEQMKQDIKKHGQPLYMKGTDEIAVGTIAGIEEDENGNFSLDPEKFILGMAIATGGKKVGKFTIDKALEKQFREQEVKEIPNEVFEQLGVDKNRVFADYIQLATKHPEYFEHPKDAKELVEYVLEKPTYSMKATKKEYDFLVRTNGKDKGTVVEFKLKGGKYRVRSVFILDDGQLETKFNKAKELGEPIFQFQYVNSK